MKTAVIIIDMQNDFFQKDPLKSVKPLLVEKINELTDLARIKGNTLIISLEGF